MTYRVDFSARVSGEAKLLIIEPPRVHLATVDMLLERSAAKHGGYMRTTFAMPFRARTTGAGSQNHAIYGIFSQVYKQSGGGGMPWEEWCDYFKSYLIPYWPFLIAPNGKKIPKSEAKLSMEEASGIIAYLLVWCAENSIELIGFEEEVGVYGV